MDGDVESAKVDSGGLVLPARSPLERISEGELKDLRALEGEVEVLEDPLHRSSYWDHFALVLREEVEKREQGGDSSTGGASVAEVVPTSGAAGGASADAKIQQELRELLEGQSLEELAQTKEELETALEEPAQDVEQETFFRAVLEKVPYYHARCTVKDAHATWTQLAKNSHLPVKWSDGPLLGEAVARMDDEADEAERKKRREEQEESDAEKKRKQDVRKRKADVAKKLLAGAKNQDESAAIHVPGKRGFFAAACSHDRVPAPAQAASSSSSVGGAGRPSSLLPGGGGPDDEEEEEDGSLSPLLVALDQLTVRTELDPSTGLASKTVKLQQHVDYQILDAQEDEEIRRKNHQKLIER